MCLPPDRRTSTGCGRLAESLVACYLELCGFSILARNQREGPRELDLIASKDGWLTVIEVRFRGRADRGLPEETLHHAKRAHLLRAGRAYWVREGRIHGRLRFDLVTLLLEEQGLRLRHHPHFLLPERAFH